MKRMKCPIEHTRYPLHFPIVDYLNCVEDAIKSRYGGADIALQLYHADNIKNEITVKITIYKDGQTHP